MNIFLRGEKCCIFHLLLLIFSRGVLFLILEFSLRNSEARNTSASAAQHSSFPLPFLFIFLMSYFLFPCFRRCFLCFPQFSSSSLSILRFPFHLCSCFVYFTSVSIDFCPPFFVYPSFVHYVSFTVSLLTYVAFSIIFFFSFLDLYNPKSLTVMIPNT